MELNQHLLTEYENTTEIEKLEGQAWYAEAHAFCLDYSLLSGVGIDYVAYVVSALSPRNKWARNKLDTTTLITAKLQGLDITDFSVSTFNANKQKAWDALDDLEKEFDPDKMFKGLKTRCFWDNIVYEDSKRVTVDTWAIRAAYNIEDTSYTKSLSTKEYLRIEQEYIDCANHLGIKPKNFQGIVWIGIRNRLTSLAQQEA